MPRRQAEELDSPTRRLDRGSHRRRHRAGDRRRRFAGRQAARRRGGRRSMTRPGWPGRQGTLRNPPRVGALDAARAGRRRPGSAATLHARDARRAGPRAGPRRSPLASQGTPRRRTLRRPAAVFPFRTSRASPSGSPSCSPPVARSRKSIASSTSSRACGPTRCGRWPTLRSSSSAAGSTSAAANSSPSRADNCSSISTRRAGVSGRRRDRGGRHDSLSPPRPTRHADAVDRFGTDDLRSLADDFEQSGERDRAIEVYRSILMSGDFTAEDHFSLAELLYR